jgi:hypothetical protein
MKMRGSVVVAALGLLSARAARAETAASGSVDSSSKIAAVQSKDVTTSGFPDDSPFEKKDTTYRFVGARFRYVVIPKFYMGLFGDGGTTVGVPAFGPEFTIRKNHFEYVFSAMYAGYAMDATPFKAKSDGNAAWEIVDTNLKALYLMSDFLWSSEMSPKFAINYGAGFGLGVVLGGDIHRQQARSTGNADDPASYVACAPNAAGTGPASPSNFCGTDNNHYGSYSEPSWADSGSKPIIFPWLSVQTGFRWKPVRQFAARFDIGWNLLNGPFVGLAANYGL